MNSRERVRAAMNFQPVDRLPKDLGAIRASGISAFAYPGLVKALGLPYRKPRVYDISQMLALPEPDVLDALGCDVAVLEIEPDGRCLTNVFHDPAYWADYDFNGRLDALVPKHLKDYSVQPDGTIIHNLYKLSMPAGAYVFNEEHCGQGVDLSGDLPLMDLDEYRAGLEKHALLKDEDIPAIVAYVKRMRSLTDRAVVVAGAAMQTPMGIAAHGGLGVFPIICLEEPEYVHRMHRISTDIVKCNIERLLPEIAGDVDILLTGGGDWGTQNSLIASAETFKTLFAPYMRELNDLVHAIDPSLKTYIHSCGAIFDLLDSYIDDCRIDIINPVQWPAGGHSFREWKDKARGRATLWGGAVNAQATLPLGTVQDIRKEALEVIRCFADDSGYVFNSIHNILAEIPAEKIVALYRTADAV